MKTIDLTEGVEFNLRGKTIKVYPLTLIEAKKLAPKLEKLDKAQGIDKLAEISIDCVFDVIKKDNDYTKEDLEKILTVSACGLIIKAAMSFNQNDK